MSGKRYTDAELGLRHPFDHPAIVAAQAMMEGDLELAARQPARLRELEQRAEEVRLRMAVRDARIARGLRNARARRLARLRREKQAAGIVTPRVRFAVLERDKFTCQYCGAKAPEVRLHVDHRTPKSKGGAGDPANLVTACSACNLGKGARWST